jgi:DNA helicase-2/ATP-dependent DNA helicase PcrA
VTGDAFSLPIASSFLSKLYNANYSMDAALEELNAAQRAAVTSPAPILQVLAPPGSGKTKTLTTRVAYLLAHHGYLPWNVICCTFTIKASREMRERLRSLIGPQLESKLILGTFHSICRRYLVAYGYLIGIPKDFGIADSSDTLSILKRIIKRFNLNLDPKAARSRISHRKARGLREEELRKAAQKSVENQELATIYDEYQRALSTSNLLDYDDLLLRCTDLLRAHPQCVSNVEALLIDEFQDTNVVQYELMKLLACKNKRITIVGDPDQSIYGFRSAESENLRRMQAYYPDTVVINLEENYRSSSAVLRLAQGLIEQDTNRPQKKLKSTHSYGTLPVLRKLPSAGDEANWLVSEIKRATVMTGKLVGFSDFAILLRAAHLSRLVEVALGKAGIPYRMVGGHRFFDREEIRILLDYLRTISQPTNNAALLAIVNVPSRKIGEETIKEFLRIAEQKSLSLWTVVQKIVRGDIALQKKPSKPAEQALGKLVNTILDAKKRMGTMIPDNAPKELLDIVITKLSFKDYLESKHPDDHENRWANVEELLTQASDLAEQKTLSTDTNFDEELPEIEGVAQQKLVGSEEVLARFLASISLSADLQTSDDGTEKQCITISTIHAAKGLEWPVVFIPAVYEGSIPHSRAEDTDEERRLLYVAMTRAQALLYLSIPRSQSRDNTETTLSQFLPSTLSRRFSDLGPEFNDKAVADMAGILRRPRPSQEQLVVSLQSMSARDSTNDDLWPADGSSGPKKYWDNDAAKPDHSGSIDRNLSSSQNGVSSQRRDGPRSLLPSASFGFTTAGEHFKSVIMPSAHATDLSSYNDQSRPQKKIAGEKNRKDRGRSTQVSLSAFFAHGSFKSAETQDPALREKDETMHHEGIEEPSLPVLHPIRKANSVPRELLSHRICSTTLPLKRRRPLLEQTTSPSRNRYFHFSSSPSGAKQWTEPQAGADQDQENDVAGEEHRSSFPAQSTSTSTSTVYCKGYMRPATTMHTTTMAMLQQTTTTTGRKTYGARRGLNSGWDARKHK